MRTLVEKAEANVTFAERLSASLLELEEAIKGGSVYLDSMYRIATLDGNINEIERAALLIQYAHMISLINDESDLDTENRLASCQVLASSQEVIKMVGFASGYNVHSGTVSVAYWATGIAVMLYNS